MIDPRPRRLQQCPGATPTTSQEDIRRACFDKCIRDGLLPDGQPIDLGYASSAGLNDLDGGGATIVAPDGRLAIILDVAQPARRLAWIALHESAELAYQLRNPDVRFQRIADRREWQRRLNEAHEQACAYADLAIHDPAIQAAILRAALTDVHHGGSNGAAAAPPRV